MVCPICTLAVAGGVGIFRAWGIDDIITGIWIGALVVSSIIWMIDYLNRKNIHFLFRKILIIISFYLIFIWPLYSWDIMGLPNNTLMGIDKILLGVIIGTIAFILAVLSDSYLRKINNNQIVIKYQKVIIPIVYLIITSIIVHLLVGIFFV